jgi:hypothetical protein
VFKKALQEFNALSARHKLKVTLVETTTKPSEQDASGADVQFDAVNGQQTIKALGQTFTTINRGGVPEPIQISGTGTEGLTITLGRSGTEKAFIFVPITPMAFSPTRLVGDPVKLFIAVHEFFHVCGLTNAEHSPEHNADAFIGTPFVTPQLIVDPKDPDGDRISTGVFGVNQKRFPPITLSARNVGLIQNNWP